MSRDDLALIVSAFSLLVAGVSLLVSFVALFYRKRAYKAVSYPEIAATLDMERHGGRRWFRVALTNYSTDLAIEWFRITVKVANPRDWRFWRRWFVCREKRHHGLPPRKTDSVRLRDYNRSFEDFLMENLPGFVEQPKDQDGNAMYLVRRDFRLKTSLVVKYKPAVADTRPRTKSKRYVVSPEFDSATGHLNAFRVKSI